MVCWWATVGEAVELASEDHVAAFLATWNEREGGFVPSILAGSFGAAVHRAHGMQLDGAGATVAIVDCGFNLDHPGLQGDVTLQGPSDPTSDHGTCVALFVRAVAPRAKLALFGLTRQDLQSVDRVAAVVDQARAIHPTVLNLSLQRTRRAARRDYSFEDVLDFGVSAAYAPEEPPCALCEAARQAHAAGIPVVTAAGNRNRVLSCPAHPPWTAAIGIVAERREEVAGTGIAWGRPPDQSHAMHADLGLFEPHLRLEGTSFAAPLFSGLLALGLPGAWLPHYFRAARLRELGDHGLATIMTRLESGAGATAERLERCALYYQGALRSLPHAHVSVQGDMAVAASPTAAKDCAWCAFLAQGLYVNLGVYLHRIGRIVHAGQMFEVARDLLAEDPHAWAGMGASFASLAQQHEAQGDRQASMRLVAEAIHCFDRARRHGDPLHVARYQELVRSR